MAFDSRKIWTSAFGLASALAMGVGAGLYFGQSSCEPAAQERISEISRLQDQLADAASRVKSLRKENASLKLSLKEMGQTALNKAPEDSFASAHQTAVATDTPETAPSPVLPRPRSVAGRSMREIDHNKNLTTTKTATIKSDSSIHTLPSLSAAERTVRPQKGLEAAQAYSPLPHMDAHIRSGNRRTITGTDVWVPLSWDGKNLTFLDARLVRDTLDDLEGNFGIGFRKIVDGGKGVWGAYGYYDARRTTYNNTFSQATLGTEWLAEDWDARANAYISLSGKKSFTTTLPTTISFSGTGLIAHGGTSTFTEVPLSGFDAEVGYKVPFPSSFPETRVYGGGYYFTGDGVDAIRGGRTRIHSDITDWLQVGAEYRRDNVRDSETFAELRLRYRFGNTSIKPPSKLLERLEEQPVRDIDIVTDGVSTQQTGTSVVTNSSSGLAQQIYVVDNTAAAGGDGSKERPFNTITAATAIASSNDIIYVRAGDGTSTGMDSGVVINDNGQRLIGSGTALTFGSLGVEVSGLSAPSNNFVIAPATSLAPIITNTAVNGDGITVAANDVYISGITVDSASRDGLRVTAGAGQNWQNLEINNVTLSNNDANGLSMITSGGGKITGPSLTDVTLFHNLTDGMQFNASGAGSSIDNVFLSGVAAEANGRYGFYGIVQTSATASSFDIADSTFKNNGEIGLYLQSNNAGSTISAISIDNSVFEDNADTGLYLYASGGGQFGTATLSDLDVKDNGENGAYVYANGAGSRFGTISLDNSSFTNNSAYGYNVYVLGGGVITNLLTSNSSFSDNGNNGYYVQVANAGSLISDLSLTDTIFENNDDHGAQIYANAGAITNATLSGLTARDNRGSGLYLQSNGATGQIGALTVSDSVADNNSDYGVYVYGTSGLISTANLSGLTVTENGDTGLYFGASGATGQLTNLNLSDSIIKDNALYGLYLYTATAGQVGTATFSGLDISDNRDHGAYFYSSGAGSLIGTLSLTDSVLNDNDGVGVYTYATGGGKFTNVSYDELSVERSGVHGFYTYLDNAASTIANFSLSNSSMIDSANSGLYLYANNGQIGTVTLSGLTSENSGSSGYVISTNAATSLIGTLSLTDSTSFDDTDYGVNVSASGGSRITTATFSDLTVTSSGNAGVYIVSSGTGSLIGTADLTNVTSNSNSIYGVYINATGGGNITSSALTGLVMNDNRESGIYIRTANASTLGALTLTDSTAEGNFVYGAYLYAANTSNFSAMLQDNSFANNYQYGVFVDDDTTGTYSADLGGGALGSTGGNRIFDSLIQDIRVDLDNQQLKAENNWWGTAAGLQATERVLDGTSTIDSTPFLAADPTP